MNTSSRLQSVKHPLVQENTTGVGWKIVNTSSRLQSVQHPLVQENTTNIFVLKIMVALFIQGVIKNMRNFEFCPLKINPYK